MRRRHEKKSGPGFQKATGSELVAVMRRNAEKAEDYARRHGVPKWYTDADQTIFGDDVDAVYIATHPDSHFQYALRTIRAGKPVYLEKPMTIQPKDSRELVDAAENAGVPLFVAYYRRGMGKFVTVKEMIDRGEIGTVRFVRVLVHQPPMVDVVQKTVALTDESAASDEAPWRLDPERSCGGLIMDVGSHGLDLLDYFLGPIRDVVGFSDNLSGISSVEDTVAGAWVFESGVHGSGVWCFSSHKEEDTIEIHGTSGMISFSVLDVPSPVTVETAAGITEHTFEPPEHVQQPLIQTVVDQLLGRGTCPSTGKSASRTDDVLYWLRRVSNSGDDR